jgi:hypothetical protein
MILHASIPPSVLIRVLWCIIVGAFGGIADRALRRIGDCLSRDVCLRTIRPPREFFVPVT